MRGVNDAESSGGKMSLGYRPVSLNTVEVFREGSASTALFHYCPATSAGRYFMYGVCRPMKFLCHEMNRTMTLESMDSSPLGMEKSRVALFFGMS